jgi:prepilin-type N-terminal cleavage/methylation domain-containing protein/prepilin-type processing-associated H-X9-DG protein
MAGIAQFAASAPKKVVPPDDTLSGTDQTVLDFSTASKGIRIMNCTVSIARRVRGRGFTLIELLVVIAIIAILAAILFPVFAQAREKARQTSCLSNEKQLALAMLGYVQDYDEQFPLSNLQGVAGQIGWANLLQPYVKSVAAYQCPDFPTNISNASLDQGAASTTFNYNTMLGYGDSEIANMGSYQMSTSSQSLAAVTNSSSTVLFMDAFPYDASSGRPWGLGYTCSGNIIQQFSEANLWGNPCSNMSLDYRQQGFNEGQARGAIQVHSGGANYAFVDGHAKWYRPEALYGSATPTAVSGGNPTFHVHD